MISLTLLVLVLKVYMVQVKLPLTPVLFIWTNNLGKLFLKGFQLFLFKISLIFY